MSRTAQLRAARLASEQLARKQRHHRARWVAASATAVLLAAALIGYGVYVSQRPAAEFPVPAAATSDRTGVQVGEGPVTVEIYLDYMCPACRYFEEAAQPLLDRYLDQGRINLVYHPVAILDRYSTNRYSSRSAAGAGCAADAGELLGYNAVLYAAQPAEGGPGYTDEDLANLAASAGVPREPFAQCLREERYADWVSHVTRSMAARGVNGTPTVFVAGQRLDNPTPANLTAAIDAG